MCNIKVLYNKKSRMPLISNDSDWSWLWSVWVKFCISILKGIAHCCICFSCHVPIQIFACIMPHIYVWWYSTKERLIIFIATLSNHNLITCFPCYLNLLVGVPQGHYLRPLLLKVVSSIHQSRDIRLLSFDGILSPLIPVHFFRLLAKFSVRSKLWCHGVMPRIWAVPL